MKYAQFQQIATPAGHVVVFVCPEEFLVQESKAIWPGIFGGAWTVDKVTAKEFEEIPSSKLLADALTRSLFAESRCYMVTMPEKLTKARLEILREVHALRESTVRVVLAAASRKPADAWAKGFPVVEIDELKPADVVRWLNQRYGISPEVARYLTDEVGTELQMLSTEMEKLMTYVGPESTVGVRDVDILLLRAEQYGPYELEDAIIARDSKKSVRIVGALLSDGSEPLMVLGSIARVWRQLFVAKTVANNRNARATGVASMVPEWKLARLISASQKIPWKSLVTGFSELIRVDRTFKTSAADPRLCLEVLLFRLLGPA